MSKGKSGEPSRERQARTLQETLRQRPPWTSWFGPIQRAAAAGNRREAIRLLDEYIKSRKAA